jgi:acetylornithine deacetylase/succinyl-diaminopimelate desuccinylase-like protein
MDQRLLDDLMQWLAIPSISTGGGDPAQLERAAAWVVERIAAAGGEARVVATDGNPLAVGELRAARPDAPTVLVYGHYDVQAVGDIDAWETPPFEPAVRDGRIYARGAADDKGNFLPLLHVACGLAADGALPVNVRVLVEGEEETGGDAVVGLRGIINLDLEVRTAARDLHSGVYGGSVLNALHALHAMLAAVLPGPDGRLREELRAGIVEPSQAERDSWATLPTGDELLAAAGARPLYPGAGADYYERNGADGSLDINAIHAGEPRTVVPAIARATLSQRLAPDQRIADIAPVLERLLRDAAPEGAEVTMTFQGGEPALFAPETQAVALAAQALERVSGVPTALVRSGGSIPVVAEFAARGIPTVVTGFSVEEDAYHAPNESFRLAGLEQGAESARELYHALAALTSVPA